MSRPRSEADDDSYESWKLSIDTLLEINIRKRVVLPDPGDVRQARWWDEGPRERTSQLDTVQEGRK